METTRKQLSAAGLYDLARNHFKKIKEKEHVTNSINIPIVDYLMSGLAVFSMKFPSLLQFDENRAEEYHLRHNLKTLFKIQQAPCDTQLRTKLDDLEPALFRPVFKKVFAALQRGKALEPYKYINDSYLLAIDGTGMFHSSAVRCENCCKKEHKNGTVTYYHNMLCGAIVHPGIKTVFPLAPEAMLKQDGSSKNDCEFNACRRFLLDVKREHPHLKLTILEDGLYGKWPHLQLIKELGMHYIIVAKPGDHEYLFDAVEHNATCQTYTILDDDQTKHEFKFVNGVPLNATYYNFLVNFFEYNSIDKKGNKHHCCWITDHVINQKNIFKLMKAGRSRWHIENETFNTLKTQGYNFEHNYGHGNKNLSTIFSMLMLLAFLIDQAQEACCTLFARALAAKKRRLYFWNFVKSLFHCFLIMSWEDLYKSVIFPPQVVAIANTS